MHDCKKSGMVKISLTEKESDFVLKVMNISINNKEPGEDYSSSGFTMGMQGKICSDLYSEILKRLSQTSSHPNSQLGSNIAGHNYKLIIFHHTYLRLSP